MRLAVKQPLVQPKVFLASSIGQIPAQAVNRVERGIPACHHTIAWQKVGNMVSSQHSAH